MRFLDDKSRALCGVKWTQFFLFTVDDHSNKEAVQKQKLLMLISTAEGKFKGDGKFAMMTLEVCYQKRRCKQYVRVTHSIRVTPYQSLTFHPRLNFSYSFPSSPMILVNTRLCLLNGVAYWQGYTDWEVNRVWTVVSSRFCKVHDIEPLFYCL